MYTVSVENGKPLRIDELNENEAIIDGVSKSYDLVKIDPTRYHLILDGTSYEVDFISRDSESKTVVLKINNRQTTIQLKDKYDALLEKLGLDNLASQRVSDIKAPMPGLVLGVELKPGDVFKKGDPLLVLEAMKMENVIKAPCDGTVKSIAVAVQQAVDKNQVLVELE